MIPIFSAAVSDIMPMMLDGIGTPVRYTTNSPSAKNANKIKHCTTISDLLLISVLKFMNNDKYECTDACGHQPFFFIIMIEE